MLRETSAIEDPQLLEQAESLLPSYKEDPEAIPSIEAMARKLKADGGIIQYTLRES
jgi:hypothetical protein